MTQMREHLSNYKSSANLIDRLEAAARWHELNPHESLYQAWQIRPFSDVELMREAAKALRELERSKLGVYETDF
jgi:hypothetical protein